MRKVFSYIGQSGNWETIYKDTNNQYWCESYMMPKIKVSEDFVRMEAWFDLNRNMKRVPNNFDVDCHIS